MLLSSVESKEKVFWLSVLDLCSKKFKKLWNIGLVFLCKNLNLCFLLESVVRVERSWSVNKADENLWNVYLKKEKIIHIPYQIDFNIQGVLKKFIESCIMKTIEFHKNFCSRINNFYFQFSMDCLKFPDTWYIVILI